jgi:hypothetical protein
MLGYLITIKIETTKELSDEDLYYAIKHKNKDGDYEVEMIDD